MQYEPLGTRGEDKNIYIVKQASPSFPVTPLHQQSFLTAAALSQMQKKNNDNA